MGILSLNFFKTVFLRSLSGKSQIFMSWVGFWKIVTLWWCHVFLIFHVPWSSVLLSILSDFKRNYLPSALLVIPRLSQTFSGYKWSTPPAPSRGRIPFFFFFLFFCLFRAAPSAHGSFQARGQIGAAADGLHHSNTRSKPRLWLPPQLTTMLDP